MGDTIDLLGVEFAPEIEMKSLVNIINTVNLAIGRPEEEMSRGIRPDSQIYHGLDGQGKKSEGTHFETIAIDP
jgi:hypothetical protein